MARRNLFYAQSGGVTAAINATAAAVIETARHFRRDIGKVYAGRDGIIGALTEDLIDTSHEPARTIKALKHTPGGAFGSCRYKLRDAERDRSQYERLIEVFRAHNIGYFLYNGGNDSADTSLKIAREAARLGFPLVCVGIPKTVDNDLPVTDCCPGFGSVAKYVAVSVREAGFDVESMARTSTRVFVLEVMGRHAGWITAACGLAAEREGDAPHLLLLPEMPFEKERFLARVEECVRRHESCTIAVSEGLRRPDGHFIAETGLHDAFGHAQLGGVAPVVADLVRESLAYKCHWAVADYLQRSARHIASKTDLDQSYAVGKAAVEFAVKGYDASMPVIVRKSDRPYRWTIGRADLADIANREKQVPREFIREDGFHITDACRAYLAPLIAGEAYPPYRDGLPRYVRLRNRPVPRRLGTEFTP